MADIKLSFTRANIVSTACHILDLNPDPVPHYLVLRDLLRCSPTDTALLEAEQNLSASKWIEELDSTQHSDGTWGRFHTQDTRVKTLFPTTEFAIRRALELGLDHRSSILQKASGFIQAHLQGTATWSDWPEKHDDPRVFPSNIRSISAAMLALIDRHHPLLDSIWLRWNEIVRAAFASGTYDREAELARHQSLTSIPSRRLIPFHAYYPLIILSATQHQLPQDLEHRLLEYLLHRPEGIYYVCNQSLDTFPRLDDRKILPWLHGQEILARFEGWKAFAPDILNWLWSQRNETGLWDMGKSVDHSIAFPLSESWRRTSNRMIDCSVKILCLLQRYFES